MNLGAFLAGFGPGILDAQTKLAQQRAEDQRLQLLGLEAQARIRQMQDDGDTVKGFNSAMGDLQGGADAPTAPPNISGQAPQYPGTGDPNLSAGGALVGDHDAALVRKYESEGLANRLGISPYAIGVGGTDLSNAPHDQYGFPQWAGRGNSHAAGAYQFQPGTWGRYAAPLGVHDFSPESQDRVFQAAHQAEGWKPWAPYNSKIAAATSDVSGRSGGGGNVPPVQLAQSGPTTMTDASPQMRPNSFAAPTAGAPKAAGADPANADARQVAQVTAPTIDPSFMGKMSPEGIARSIEKAIPHASPRAKHDAIMEMSKFLSPWMRQQWEERRDQTQRQQQLEDAEKRRREHLADQEHGDRRDDIRDERSERHFKEHKEYDAEHPNYQPQEFLDEKGNVQWVRPGQPVSPGWHRAPAGSGAGGRDADIAREIKRRDTAYAKEHPKATEDEIEAAHFQHSEQVNRGMAEAKAAPARTMTSAIARAYLENHPEATADDLIKLNGAIRREASIQTAFAGGEAGRQVRSLNTLADHIALTREYGDAISKGEFPRANAALNRWSIETGHAEVNDFKVARNIMSGEFVKLLTSTGGTDKDREEMRGAFEENASPEAMAGALNVATRFVGGRLTGLQQQYARNDPKRIEEFRSDLLSSGSREIFLSQIPRASEQQQLPPGTAIQPQQMQPGAQPQAGQQRGAGRFMASDPSGLVIYSDDGQTWFNSDGSPYNARPKQ